MGIHNKADKSGESDSTQNKSAVKDRATIRKQFMELYLGLISSYEALVDATEVTLIPLTVTSLEKIENLVALSIDKTSPLQPYVAEIISSGEGWKELVLKFTHDLIVNQKDMPEYAQLKDFVAYLKTKALEDSVVNLDTDVKTARESINKSHKENPMIPNIVATVKENDTTDEAQAELDKAKADYKETLNELKNESTKTEKDEKVVTASDLTLTEKIVVGVAAVAALGLVVYAGVKVYDYFAGGEESDIIIYDELF